MGVIIAGAGVAGLCCAYELARRGHRVEVFDPVSGISDNGCSRYAGGMLAPWCERESAEEEVLTLGTGAIDWWGEIEPDMTRAGTLVVAPPRDGAELARFSRRTSGHRKLDAAEIAELEPALAGRFSQGLFYHDEAHLDPRTAMNRLVDRIRALGGAVHFSTPAPEQVDVDCRGLSSLGEVPELRAVRGEMLVLRRPDLEITRTVRLLHPRFPAYLVPRGDGVYMLGATMVETDADGPITLRSMMELLSAAYALHPGFAEAEILETGVGLRPSFPDNLPKVVEQDGTFHVNGMYRHGFLLAPAMAQRLVQMMFPGDKT